MKILVLNCGSSSVKYKLFNMDTHEVLAQGGVEKLGLPGSFLKFTQPDGKKVILDKELPEHNAAIEFILSVLTDEKYGCIKSFNEIDAVGHRVVHGGEAFSGSVEITPEVIGKMVECIDLAPLHNPPNLKGIRAMSALIPGIRQVGVFDTAFHQTMPDYAYMYGLPYSLYKKYGIRRYGFHGTSHMFVSGEAIKFGNLDPEKAKVIVCHLGNGASVSASIGGKCVDTSMGLTPLEGLIMGTRSGDVDPAVVQFIANKENMDVNEVLNVLNKKSGVLGMTNGISSDFRDIENAAKEGNHLAEVALDAFVYRVAKYVGAYTAAMNGVDAIAFTAGVGENDKATRKKVCEYLGYLGVKIDDAANDVRGKRTVISAPDSKVKVMLIPTNEELAIARETLRLVK